MGHVQCIDVEVFADPRIRVHLPLNDRRLLEAERRTARFEGIFRVALMSEYHTVKIHRRETVIVAAVIMAGAVEPDIYAA